MMSKIEQEEANTFKVLQETLYRGAKKESIAMVMSYCTAMKLDPLLKPVHIVPMSTWTGKLDSQGKRIYEKQDTIMPGIGLYRILAARSGSYAGISKPIFGPSITETIGKKTITYPEYCTMVIRKIVQGHVCEFERTEYWIENYASISKIDLTPNDMWCKRSRGQLVKCTESQLIRAAFPECIAADVTFEEMEGKVLIGTEEKIVKTIPDKAQALEHIDEDGVINTVTPSNEKILFKLMNLIKELNISQEEQSRWCNKANVTSLAFLDEDKVDRLISVLVARKQMAKEGELDE